MEINVSVNIWFGRFGLTDSLQSHRFNPFKLHANEDSREPVPAHSEDCKHFYKCTFIRGEAYNKFLVRHFAVTVSAAELSLRVCIVVNWCCCH